MNEANNIGCTRDCSKCSSAQHSYCSVVIAQKNQELLLAILGMMARPTELITPKQGGDEDPDENKPKNKTK